MEAIQILLEAGLALEKAASDFLDACAALKLMAIPSLASALGQRAFENNIGNILSSVDSTSLVENRMRESRILLNKLLNMSTVRVPVHQLPVETLGYIFSIVVASSPCFPVDKLLRDGLLDIPRVCVRWNQVAIDTPSLWSHIDINLSQSSVATTLERAQLWLKRCHNMPIHLHLDGIPDLQSKDVPDLLAFMRPHGGSLGSLVFTNYCHRSLVHALLSLTSGSLKTLVASNTVAPFDQEDVSSLPTGLLCGLTTLDLMESDQVICPSVSDVAKLLSGNSTLHTLRLRHFRFRSSSLQTYPPILLPQLRFLEVVNVRGDEVPLLFSNLVPGILELDVRLDAKYFGDDRLGSSAQQLLARSNVVSLSIYNLLLDTTEQLLRCLPSAPRLRVLRFSDMSLARSLAQALATTVEDQPSLQLPCLRSLCLFGCHVDPWAVIPLEQIIGQLRFSNLAFLNCQFPPSFTQPTSSDRESENKLVSESYQDHHKYQYEMPQTLRDWFLARVERVVVDTTPTRSDQTYHGVDPFVQKLM
ncbi:hypothetical protein FRC12_008704 [Ceratobasidium sp. 428]|nr:hypothetical protein FRC12_008704 [Ceratobasidium sp. 428]